MASKAYYPPVNIASRVLAERTIPYRPLFKQMVNNINSSILLSQIVYWWYKKQEQPFFKFAAPSEHKAYKKDDSWQEELGFTRTELDTALKYISTKIAPKERKNNPLFNAYDDGKIAPVNRIVIYWRDRDNITWYWLNTTLLEAHLKATYAYLYADTPSFADVENLQPLIADNLHSSDVENLHYPYTEITTETTKEEKNPATQGDTTTDKKQRPMYDAIKLVWGYEGAMNGRFAKFLEGRATKADGVAYLEANVIPACSPIELVAWNAWYRQRNASPTFIMLKVVAKVQESIYEYRRIQQSKVIDIPQGTTPANELEAEMQRQLHANLNYANGGNNGNV